MKERVVALLVLLAGLLGFWLGQPFSEASPAAAAALPLAGKVVGVDPGHGGYDAGCTGAGGACEKALNLEVALQLREALEARGARVVLSRETDIALIDPENTPGYKKRKELTRRLEIFAAAEVDCVLSVHMNEFTDPAQHGAQVFYQTGAPESETLARALQASLCAFDPDNDRRANAGDYYILTGTPASALVECGFLSNPEEEARLLDRDYQRALAEAVADGLAAYFAAP